MANVSTHPEASSLRGARILLPWLLASLLATLAGTAVATLLFLFITTGAIALLALITVVVPIGGMITAAPYVAILTFGLFPGIALLCGRRYRTISHWIIPAAGFACGALPIALATSLWQFVLAGAAAGLISGLVYARRIKSFDNILFPDVTSATLRPARRVAWHGFRYIGLYFALGTITSAIVAMCGTLLVFILGMGPIGVLAVVVGFPLVPMFGLLYGFAWSLPVTFVVLPTIALLLWRRPATALFAMGTGGAISGTCMMWWVMSLLPKYANLASAFIGAGAAAGLIAGIVYAALTRGATGLSKR